MAYAPADSVSKFGGRGAYRRNPRFTPGSLNAYSGTGRHLPLSDAYYIHTAARNVVIGLIHTHSYAHMGTRFPGYGLGAHYGWQAPIRPLDLTTPSTLSARLRLGSTTMKVLNAALNNWSSRIKFIKLR